ncbi:DUF1642 domain-containing protein [Lactococcus formosensis subsp. formosensis]|uniref:DUF1642 domain-containing protein n=1 Tax=Lactococcus formosensis TaxID=1281486 RepID=UPI003854A247
MKKFEEEFDNLMRAFVDYHDCFDFDTEKCYLELKKEFIEKYAKKQQPDIPECVAEFIENYDDINETSLLYIMKDFVESNHWDVFCEIPDNLKKYGRWDDMLYKAIRFGYTVAKEKRYEVVFLEDDTTRQILMENNAGYYFIEEESENYGYWKQDFTEMEIKEINEKFWQLSVPVKDEQIEVEE